MVPPLLRRALPPPRAPQGRLLGPGGKTLTSMVEESGCGMEVHDRQGHLNGRHPDPLDPHLHVLCFADTMVG
jgi:hypothetical protein